MLAEYVSGRSGNLLKRLVSLLPNSQNRSYSSCFSFQVGASPLPAIDDGTVVLNCIVEGAVNIGSNSVVTHCHLNVRWFYFQRVNAKHRAIYGGRGGGWGDGEGGFTRLSTRLLVEL